MININYILELISKDLDISETMFNKAVESYNAVGKWLEKDGLLGSGVEIYAQGSFALGTIVKPLTDEDDGYDIDLVCQIAANDSMSARTLKNTVGESLKRNKMYNGKLDDEGKRCWTLDYAGFHMDILPAKPNTESSYLDDSIKITHTSDFINYEYKESNPKGYKNWFLSVIKKEILESTKKYASEHNMEIEDVPEYRVKSTLQQAIQLLKRHRDIMYDKKENAPISIIITTLAAKSYKGSNSLSETLSEILDNMDNHIEITGDKYTILNPVNDQENFADKWEMEPIKKDEFFKWVLKAKNDLVTIPKNYSNLIDLANHFKTVLGENTTTRSITEFAKTIKDSKDQDELYFDDKKMSVTKNKTSKPLRKNTFYGR